MDLTIYLSSSGEGMTKGDVMDYLKLFYIINPQYISWGFDDITGGETEFLSRKAYLELKDFFEK